jgi:hypothetical protein
MIFIWGSYGRSRLLRETAHCERCGKTRPIEFQRVWRTAHFFFFPLFSYSQAVLSRCEHCRREGCAYYPGPLPPLPFLDRLGFLFPVGAIGGLMLLMIAAVATAPSHGASSNGAYGTHAEQVRRRLESAALQRDANGGAGDDAKIARVVRSTIEARTRTSAP